jgi:cytoskeletal protein CcmA (bactofilin family)
MFSRKKNKSNSNLPAISSAPSIIVSDLNISGDLVSQGSIEIGGKVKGNVKCNNVIIRKESKVDGDIFADKLVIKGVVKGIVNVDDVIIDESGVFEGQINYKNLTTKPGANINGILNKVDKPKEEVISDDDASHEFNKSDSTPINEVNDNDSNDDLEYIPSISSLIDTKDEGDTSSLLEFEEEDVKTNEVNGTSAEKINIQSIKNSKASKKSSILDDNSFDFIPPKKSKKKKA